MNVPDTLRAEGATRNDWYFNMALAGLGLALAQFPYLIIMELVLWHDPFQPNFIAAAVCGTLAFASLAFRRHFPPVFFLTLYVLTVVQLVFCELPTISWILIPVAMYDVARWMGLKLARFALIGWIVIAVVSPVRWFWRLLETRTRAGESTSEVVILIILAVVSSLGAVITLYSIGRRGYDVAAARTKQRLAESEATHSMLAEQVAQQKSAESRIRTDIARELHDIVAHSIAVMIVQAEGGLSQSRKSPAKAQQALSTIADTGRESLIEMRRIVYMLRTDSVPDADLASVPKLNAIPALVEKANARLTILGTAHSTTPSLESTIYRVIQEGLTNALKHAGADSEPTVVIKWRPNEVTVTVTNHASLVPAVSDHRGNGLLGMAERVQAHDGILTVGPTDTGDFEVCAQFPLQS
ncbi:MAG: histidine kinase [Propionibacteriaceae bacterium]|jgi:signal transduction histidine kinase|nr:histidine kinase [Propionibacteriaceae bacterium]